MFLTRLFVGRPTLVFVFIVLVAIVGTFSALTLIEQQFPTVDIPTISVQVSYTGASSTEMRDAIVRPLEDAIAGAPSLSYVNSSIQQGQATITAAFDLSSDKNTDLIEVQRRVVSAQSQLPSDVRSPTVSTFDPSQSVVVTLVASSTTLASHDLASLVSNDVIPALEQVPGVSIAQAQGAVTPALVVAVDPRRLSSSGATLGDVITAVGANNVRAPGGYATRSGKETSIDVRADIRDPASVAGLLLSSGAAAPSASAANAWTVAARLLHVSDVADVYSGYEPPRSFAFYNGRAAITINVLKATGSSEVAASNAVLGALPALRRRFPTVTFTVATVQSTFTQQQLTGVARTLAEGIVLTAIVMILFLQSWRNAVVVMIAIPTSLAVTLGIMRAAGFTVDMISLLAMTLIIGILVDDSIVVLENTQRHHHDGELPRVAAVNGRAEIGLAAIVITLVDVAVFAPIAFLPGTVGKFLNEFGLVVVTATLTSLFVSFTMTPALAGNWSLGSAWTPPGFVRSFGRGFERLRTWYSGPALAWALRRRWWIVAVAGLSLVGSIALIPLGIVGFEFIPAVDRGQLYVQLTFPPGTAIDETRRRMLAVERYIDGIGSDLENESAIAGGTTSQLGGVVNQGSVAQINVNFVDGRKHSTQEWTREFAARIPAIVPQAKVVVIPATGMGGGVTQPIVYIVTGTGSVDPTAAAGRVAALLQSVPGAANVSNGATSLAPQVEIDFDRDAARALGVDIGTAAASVRAAFGGDTVTQYTTPAGLQDVQIIYPAADRTDLGTIASIAIRSGGGAVVHLGDFAVARDVPAPPLITRQNRQTVITVGANIAPGYVQSNVQSAFIAKLKHLTLPPGITVGASAGGTQQNLSDTITGMTFALVLAMTLVFLLMVALFNSYRSPAIILFSVPVAVVGALGSLALTHLTLNLFSLIGTVLLIGLVSKNGILLVDFANSARERGRGRHDAIVEAANMRFRPIVMTTLSMISGMLPIALAIDPGSDTRRALGVVVIGGLTSSLVLTLFIVPIMYLWLAPRDVVRTHSLDDELPGGPGPRPLSGLAAK
jgi:HAE1 family hydrophobic/amphiphilic exporter-1